MRASSSSLPCAVLIVGLLAACGGGDGQKGKPDPCEAGAACAAAEPCRTGVVSCSTGAPVCQASGNVADGMTCGGENVCTAGVCGAAPSGPRTVRGTYSTVWWHDDGTKETVASPPTPASTKVGALTWSGGAWVDHAGSVDQATGDLSIPDVPAGRYLLYLDRRASGGALTAEEHFASMLDLSRQRAGRPDAALIAAAPLVTWNVSGLVPWTTRPYAPGDLLEISGGRIWEPLAGLWYASDLEQGVTSASVQRRWGAMGQSAYPDTSKGDVLELHQLATVTLPPGEAGAGVTFRALAGVTRLQNLVFGDGATATVTATLLPPSRTANVSGLFATAAAEQLAPGLGYPAESNGYTLEVFTQAHRTAYPAPVDPGGSLLELTATPGTPAFTRALPYGRTLDLTRQEVVCAGVEGLVPYRATGSTAETSLGAYAQSCWAVAGAPATLAPQLGAITALTVEGVPFTAARIGVGATPLVGWSPPAVGVAGMYTLSVRELSVTASGSTSGRTVATFSLAPPAGGVVSFRIPPGVLQAGREYKLLVQAYAGEGYGLDKASARGYPNSTALHVSPNLTCAPAP